MNQHMKLVSVKWTGDELCVGNDFFYSFSGIQSSDFITSLFPTQALQLLKLVIYRCSQKQIKITVISKRKPKSRVHFIRPVTWNTDPAKSRQIPREALDRPVPRDPVPLPTSTTDNTDNLLIEIRWLTFRPIGIQSRAFRDLASVATRAVRRRLRLREVQAGSPMSDGLEQDGHSMLLMSPSTTSHLQQQHLLQPRFPLALGSITINGPISISRLWWFNQNYIQRPKQSASTIKVIHAIKIYWIL